jgi:hypothetical protein
MTSWPSEIEKVYLIAHPIKEKERFDRLIQHVVSRGVPPERIEVVAPTWGTDLTSDLIFQVYDPYLKRPCPCFTFKGRNLTRPEISLALNFYAAMRSAVEKTNKFVITLESDVYLREDFVSRLKDLVKDLEKKQWDYVSLGEGVGTRPPGCHPSMYAPTKAYEPPHQLVFRCTDSMLFQTHFLRKVISTFIPFREIIDWEMNFQNLVHKGIALWADPPLAEQGTCFGRIVSSLPA